MSDELPDILGEARLSEVGPTSAALRQEGDAWDVAGHHYLAHLLHGAADEIDALRSSPDDVPMPPCRRDECRHLRWLVAQSVPMVEWEAWREVAIALVSEIADELLDPNSMAMQAYGHARNHRFNDAITTARDSLIISGLEP